MNLICKLIGHKFKPRYSEVPNPNYKLPKDFYNKPTEESLIQLGSFKVEIIRLDIINQYECDICERCGKVIKK